jgi:hypothetical protein
LALLARARRSREATVPAGSSSRLAIVAIGSDDARALAEDFLRRYPHSAYALRLKSQLHLP